MEALAAFCVLACAAVVAFALVDSSESGSIPLGWGPEGTLVVNSSPAGGSAPESVRYGGESYVFHIMLDNFINLTVNNKIISNDLRSNDLNDKIKDLSTQKT